MSTPRDERDAATSTGYRLGCPVWACDAWVGELYSTRNRRSWLREYSSVFGTVEGNSTFYALPAADVVRRWSEEAAPGFRFALKTPAAITHERQLANAEHATSEWIERLLVLREAGRLGPTLLQLPPFFAGSQFDDLARYVATWPAALPLAVEPRHDDYFAGGTIETELDALLRQHGCDRALFDSRALFHAPPSDPIEVASQSRKPNPRRRVTVTGKHPFVRFVGRNKLETVDPWIAEWAATIGGWIDAGAEPYVFCHAPDDALAPLFCERLHAAVQANCAAAEPLPPWPGRSEPKQRSLF